MTGRFDTVDYLGVGYGATPRLVEFWTDCGYRTVHLSTTRNDERVRQHAPDPSPEPGVVAVGQRPADRREGSEHQRRVLAALVAPGRREVDCSVAVRRPELEQFRRGAVPDPEVVDRLVVEPPAGGSVSGRIELRLDV